MVDSNLQTTQITPGHSGDISEILHAIGIRAKEAAYILGQASTEQKNAALEAMATALEGAKSHIIKANQEDMAAARQRNLSPALLDRLLLDDKRLKSLQQAVLAIAELPDPIGEVMESWQRPNGLRFEKRRVNLGVIGMIYESRPNVTADAGALCLKSGNAVILRCGSESFASSTAICQALQEGLRQAGLPEAAIQIIPTRERAAVDALLRLDAFVNVIIPRGGRGLIEKVTATSRIPVLKHLDGICHTYLHRSAEPKMACEIVHNAKMRRTGICGATETLLVDQEAAAQLLPAIIEDLLAAGCELRGDQTVQSFDTRILPATEEDWRTEYLDAILSIRVVPDITAAIAHINQYGSHHTEAIIAADSQAVAQFFAEIDSGIVLHNASTQFADGGEFGMGAEIGISTGKLHARGPVGVRQLTSYKYVVHGTGHTRP